MHWHILGEEDARRTVRAVQQDVAPIASERATAATEETCETIINGIIRLQLAAATTGHSLPNCRLTFSQCTPQAHTLPFTLLSLSSPAYCQPEQAD